TGAPCLTPIKIIEETPMLRTTPPFRADHVGSLLRPKEVKEARTKREKGEIGAAELAAVEDEAIKRLIRKQEEIGLSSITDGECRRSWWHYDFLGALDGVKMVAVEHGIQFAGVQTKAEAPRIMGKIGFSDHPFLKHFAFLKANTRKTPKMTIPGPS